MIMKTVPDFREMRDQLAQTLVKNRRTLCIDIINVLVRKININEPEDINFLKEATNFETFIVVDKN